MTLLYYFLIWPLFRGYGRNPGKNFVGFLGDLKTSKGHFEINWPLVLTSLLTSNLTGIYLQIFVAVSENMNFVYKQDWKSF